MENYPKRYRSQLQQGPIFTPPVRAAALQDLIAATVTLETLGERVPGHVISIPGEVSLKGAADAPELLPILETCARSKVGSLAQPAAFVHAPFEIRFAPTQRPLFFNLSGGAQ